MIQGIFTLVIHVMSLNGVLVIPVGSNIRDGAFITMRYLCYDGNSFHPFITYCELGRQVRITS